MTHYRRRLSTRMRSVCTTNDAIGATWRFCWKQHWVILWSIYTQKRGRKVIIHNINDRSVCVCCSFTCTSSPVNVSRDNWNINFIWAALVTVSRVTTHKVSSFIRTDQRVSPLFSVWSVLSARDIWCLIYTCLYVDLTSWILFVFSSAASLNFLKLCKIKYYNYCLIHNVQVMFFILCFLRHTVIYLYSLKTMNIKTNILFWLGPSSERFSYSKWLYIA